MRRRKRNRAFVDWTREREIEEERNRSKMIVTYACLTLKAHGATLESEGHHEWVIELKDGSWLAANSVAELAECASRVVSGNPHGLECAV